MSSVAKRGERGRGRAEPVEVKPHCKSGEDAGETDVDAVQNVDVAVLCCVGSGRHGSARGRLPATKPGSLFAGIWSPTPRLFLIYRN